MVCVLIDNVNFHYFYGPKVQTVWGHAHHMHYAINNINSHELIIHWAHTAPTSNQLRCMNTDPIPFFFHWAFISFSKNIAQLADFGATSQCKTHEAEKSALKAAPLCVCVCVLAVVATLLIIYNCAVNIALRATKLIRTSMDTICVAHIIPNIFHTHTLQQLPKLWRMTSSGDDCVFVCDCSRLL